MAYQTFIVHMLAIATIFITLIAGNMVQLGITSPWVTLVIIPGLVGGIFYAGNQLKTIGQPPPNTIKTTTEETTTPPAP